MLNNTKQAVQGYGGAAALFRNPLYSLSGKWPETLGYSPSHDWAKMQNS